MATPHRLQQAVLVVKDPPANAEDVRDEVSIPRWERSPGRGNGNPLQHSCLENALDGESWRNTVPGAAKSRTRLCDWVAAEAQPMGSVAWPLNLGRGGESQPLDHQGALGYACCLLSVLACAIIRPMGQGLWFVVWRSPSTVYTAWNTASAYRCLMTEWIHRASIKHCTQLGVSLGCSLCGSALTEVPVTDPEVSWQSPFVTWLCHVWRPHWRWRSEPLNICDVC